MSDFSAIGIPEFEALASFILARRVVPVAEAVSSQPEFERELRSLTMSLERAVHGQDLTRLDLDVSAVLIDGQRYRRSHRAVGRVETLAGPVQFEHTVYRCRGGHGGQCVGVVEARIGAVDGSVTLAAARMLTSYVATVTPTDAEKLLKEIGTSCPSRSTLDRLPKNVSEHWEGLRAANEERVRVLHAADLPEKGEVATIALSLDGVMVRMKDAPNTPGAGRDDEGPKGHREASSGTVALYDRDGNRLQTVYYGRMPESKKVKLHDQLVGELAWVISRYPTATVVAIADGAHENWRIVEAIASKLKISIMRITDYYHASDHLDEGCKAVGMTDAATKECKRRLLLHTAGAAKCIEDLRARAKRTPPRSAKRRKTLEKTITYFSNNAERMRYAEAEAQNLPVGSGVQEAACKTLVVQRMKCSGMSWRDDGGQAILTLRSLQQSGRTHAAWEVMQPQFRADVTVDTDQRQTPQLRAA